MAFRVMKLNSNQSIANYGIKEIFMQKDFEQLPHTADIKLRVYGKTLQDLFKNALNGMFQIVRPIAPACTIEQDRVVCNSLPQQHDVNVTAIDRDALLVDFLSEALYLSDAYNEAYFDATIHELDNQHIVATVHGTKIEGFQVVELKAVTHHDLRIEQIDNVWRADIVFDI